MIPSLNAVDCDQPAQIGRAIKIPDPLACEPTQVRPTAVRARAHPSYLSSIIEPTELVLGGCSALVEAHWKQARIQSTPNEQFATFHLKQSSHSSFSPKTGRLCSGLGAHERAWAQQLAVDPKWLDFEMQGITLVFDNEQSYRPDWIAVDWHGFVHAGEIKADRSYYCDPEYANKLTAAESGCSQIGISFHRSSSDADRRSVRRTINIGRAYGDAFTQISDAQRAVIDDVFAENLGVTKLGRIETAISRHPAEARAITNAALCQRLISYDLNLRVDAETVVRTPRTPEFIPDIRAIDATVML